MSVSSDKNIIIWEAKSDSLDGLTDHKSWSIHQKFENAHPESITCLTVLRVSESEVYFATMCAAGTLKFWQLGPEGSYS